MNYSSLELNEILEQTSKCKHWNSFNRKDFEQCKIWSNNVADVNNPKTCFRKITNPYTDNFRSEYHSQIGLSRSRSADLGDAYSDFYGPPLDPNLEGGRLLVMRPNDTLSDGIAEHITNGFFDVDNFPPPMLTLALVDCPEFYKSDYGMLLRQDVYILSYIPKPFLPMVHEAILANAEECIVWLEDEKHFTARIFKSKGLWIDGST